MSILILCQATVLEMGGEESDAVKIEWKVITSGLAMKKNKLTVTHVNVQPNEKGFSWSISTPRMCIQVEYEGRSMDISLRKLFQN